MQTITTIEALEDLYDAAVPTSLTKVAPRITLLYRQWIEASRFCVVSTVGPEGVDGSPRGDDGPVVTLLSDTELALPDWRGNNRIDSLRNIVRDGRMSLMFMVPGSRNVVRVNGQGVLSVDPALLERFEKGGKRPKAVIVLRVGEVYFQCAKAVMRAQIWSGVDESAAVPTAGQMVREADAGFDAESYDAGYEDYAKPRMW